MQRNLIVAALAAGSATLAPAAADAADYRFTVRNDSGATLNCRVQREGSSRYETVVLRAGREWSATDSRARSRTIYCDPPAAPIRYRLRAGATYHIVPQATAVQMVLRPL